ncbi:hypothetical protein TrCOL_g2613 [Triparma columacea]|uniref:Cilia- and flagella-associated protein 45 n=1 Tax=Triparma columacea TaxID=722753 RepID=A0A9W7GC66_9STRA|nr:hypothetical protein TrCOL_g2613 [Triparma columacea]
MSRHSTPKYRVVGNGGVDESLFGTTNKKAPRTRIRKDQLPSNAICISKSDYEKMRVRSILRSQAEEDAEAARIEAIRAEKEQVARARKARMIKMEDEAKAKTKKSQSEEISEQRAQAIRKMAVEKIDQQNDLVKLLNTYSQRAMAFTIRDQQMADRHRREAMEAEYEKRMDIAMEIDRLKELAAREKEENSKLSKRIEDRSVIIDQIEARKKMKILQEEAREQENKQMLQTIKKYEEEDKIAAEKKEVEIAKARVEVIKANKDAINAKKHLKLREKEEVEMILAYQAKQDEKMRQREDEENERKRLVNERQKKMLDNQTKHQGKQAEIDELRARRAMEEGERRARQKELWKAHKQKQDAIMMNEARKQQQAEKEAAVARLAAEKQDEYESAVKYAYQMAEREERERQEKDRMNEDFRKDLRSQIQKLEDGRMMHRNDKEEEGRMIKKEMATERIKLFAIRDKMVNDMKKKGIDDRYLSEMMGIDIAKLQMR